MDDVVSILCIAPVIAGLGALVYWGRRRDWATGLLFFFGLPSSAFGVVLLVAGSSYSGSASPSMGPGLGAVVALAVGFALLAIGIPLLWWGVVRARRRC